MSRRVLIALAVASMQTVQSARALDKAAMHLFSQPTDPGIAIEALVAVSIWQWLS